MVRCKTIFLSFGVRNLAFNGESGSHRMRMKAYAEVTAPVMRKSSFQRGISVVEMLPMP
jgi:hypothetical protein